MPTEKPVNPAPIDPSWLQEAPVRRWKPKTLGEVADDLDDAADELWGPNWPARRELVYEAGAMLRRAEKEDAEVKFSEEGEGGSFRTAEYREGFCPECERIMTIARREWHTANGEVNVLMKGEDCDHVWWSGKDFDRLKRMIAEARGLAAEAFAAGNCAKSLQVVDAYELLRVLSPRKERS